MIQPARLVIVVTLLATVIAGCGDSPTAPTDAEDAATTSPTTLTFPGAVGPGGSVSRTFVATRPGTASVTVSAISPGTVLGVGLGVPRADGLACLLAQSTVASDGATAQVATAVDAGSYCAMVFAPAAAAEHVLFTVTLVHP